jgi:hypothetical protein
MSYIYSEVNRLEEPHNYMYTPFEGDGLIKKFAESRRKFLAETFYTGSNNTDLWLEALLPSIEITISSFGRTAAKYWPACATPKNDTVDHETSPLSVFSMSEEVITKSLLLALAFELSQTGVTKDIKSWLDRLTGRFEVTKKLYTSYLPGFRKGSGSNRETELYWLMSLVLGLYYLKTEESKYLSTLLKVSDLLCSLPSEELQKLDQNGLRLVIALELIGVESLAIKKSLGYAFE